MARSAERFRLPSVDVIKPYSLASKAADTIRSMVIRGECPQGAKLIEEDISSTLGVSRACVREAFIVLEGEGLLNRIQNKYTEVVSFTKADIEELYKVRLAIETMCLETCFEKDIDLIRALSDQVQATARVIVEESGNSFAWVEEDMKFHEIIVRASGIRRAQKIWLGIKSQMETLLFSQYKNEPFDLTSGISHEKITDAIAARDPEAAVILLKKHIRSGCKVSLECIECDFHAS
ncbi:MAG: GntR family transcriptional regulator [Clostridia bacterium]|nr:GntR family transcriptional regulator [Clostridia bacterium]